MNRGNREESEADMWDQFDPSVYDDDSDLFKVINYVSDAAAHAMDMTEMRYRALAKVLDMAALAPPKGATDRLHARRRAMVKGSVKWFDPVQGFGFLTVEVDGVVIGEVPVQSSDLIEHGQHVFSGVLREGEPVSFTVERSPEGVYRAVGVQ